MKNMHTTRLVFVFAILLVFSATGCATLGKPASDPRHGFLDGYYENLKAGPKDGLDEVWAKPGANFSVYNKVMVDSVVFYLAKDSEFKGIDAEQMKTLSDAFNMEMVKALQDKYPVVTEPGADVLRIRVAITDVKLSKPVLSTINSVIPVGIGINIARKGVTGEWGGAGETGMELMALDSLTNEVIALGVDKQSAGYLERYTRLGSAKDAFQFWATRVRVNLDKAHATPK